MAGGYRSDQYDDPMDADAESFKRQTLFVYFYDFLSNLYLRRFRGDLCNNFFDVGHHEKNVNQIGI